MANSILTAQFSRELSRIRLTSFVSLSSFFDESYYFFINNCTFISIISFELFLFLSPFTSLIRQFPLFPLKLLNEVNLHGSQFILRSLLELIVFRISLGFGQLPFSAGHRSAQTPSRYIPSAPVSPTCGTERHGMNGRDIPR